MRRRRPVVPSAEVFHDLGFGELRRPPGVQELAERTKVPYKALRAILAGRANPRVARLERIAAGLKVDFCDLYHALLKARARQKALNERNSIWEGERKAGKVTPLTGPQSR